MKQNIKKLGKIRNSFVNNPNSRRRDYETWSLHTDTPFQSYAKRIYVGELVLVLGYIPAPLPENSVYRVLTKDGTIGRIECELVECL